MEALHDALPRSIVQLGPSQYANPVMPQLVEARAHGAALPLEQRSQPQGHRLESALISLELQTSDVHHEKLIEIGADDGDETESLEHRRALIFGERKHPRVELHQAEIGIE